MKPEFIAARVLVLLVLLSAYLGAKFVLVVEGWGTAFFDHELVAVETLCVGRGDPHCAFEIRKAEDWGPEAEPYRQALGTNLESVVQKRD